MRDQFENKQRKKYNDYDPRNSSNEEYVDEMPLHSEITQMV